MKTRGKVAARDEAELPGGGGGGGGGGDKAEGVVGGDPGEAPLVEFPTLMANFCPPLQ